MRLLSCAGRYECICTIPIAMQFCRSITLGTCIEKLYKKMPEPTAALRALKGTRHQVIDKVSTTLSREMYEPEEHC